MIDTTQAIKYIKEVIDQLEAKEEHNNNVYLSVKERQKQLVLERGKLTERESSFLEKTNGHGAEVERITEMEALAKKMKAQVDEDRAQLVTDRIVLNKRRQQVIDLEKKQEELKKREELLEARESDIGEREEIVERDKVAARSKQADLDLREKGIKKQQVRLQRMLDVQKI